MGSLTLEERKPIGTKQINYATQRWRERKRRMSAAIGKEQRNIGWLMSHLKWGRSTVEITLGLMVKEGLVRRVGIGKYLLPIMLVLASAGTKATPKATPLPKCKVGMRMRNWDKVKSIDTLCDVDRMCAECK